jgi:5-(carboxyamino)imidazole ribonucleotide synthase
MTSGRGPMVAVVGGGQLGRMLGLAGIPLGLRFRFLEPREGCPARQLGEVIRAPYDDPDALDALARGAEVVTYEFENVPVDSARRLVAAAPVHPAPAALAMAQDRLVEKESFRALGVATAPFMAVDARDELGVAVEELGLPAVLKTRRMGYDGKGQRILRGAGDLDEAWGELGGGEHPLILEGFVEFERELSILAVRSRSGETLVWPLVENVHRDGVLVRSIAPALAVSPDLQERAAAIAGRVLDHLGYVGVLAIELFDRGGELLANEMAPRVHNSGHWTQDGSWTSQFENHLRAILGLPLGPVGVRGSAAVMLNLLGNHPPVREILAVEGVRLHLYDKAPRPGRKVGHVNVVGDDGELVRERAARIERMLAEAGRR